MSEPSLSFPPFLLDSCNTCLRRGNKKIALTLRDFEVLYYMASHPQQLVTTDTLIKEIWKVPVSRGVVKVCFHRIRQALGDSVKKPQFIENVPWRGYRFLVNARLETEMPMRSPGATTVVGRNEEIKQLHAWLNVALEGRRQIVFVTGEPGIGKTTVVRTFLDQVAATGKAAIGRGQCIEHYGVGEAYQPVLEALGRICRAPGGDTLVAWMKEHAPTWLVQMPAFLGAAESETLQQKLQGATRDRMLREFSEEIEVMTEQRPFILVLEDLQWSDYSTLDLLAALAHRQERVRFLAIGTYRPEEMLAPGNPLNRIVQELRIHNLCTELALGPLKEDDVAAYLRTRFSVNLFPEPLVRAFHRRTEGNPLFLINVVDDLVAQGVFEQTAQGWTFHSGVEVVEERVPQNVRLLVAKQGERLLPMERRVLEAASVAGMEFSTALVATALEANEEEVEEWSTGLAARQHFLQPAGFSEWPDGTISERYRFLHALYQHLWHERVGIARRQRMSQRIAEREEAAYGDRVDEVAAELAVYFEQGRDYARAAHYRARAADNAIRRCAHQEAVTHLNKGLKLLSILPDTPERTQQELALHTTLGISLQAIRGYGNPEVEQVYARAQKLSQQAREPAQLFPVLFGLWQLHLVRAEYHTARELGEQLLNLADNTRDSGLLVEAHGAVGVTLFHLGEIVFARTHLEQSTSLYDPDRHRSHVRTYNQDPWAACQSYSGQALWLLGYPDQALRRAQEAWRYAQDLAHPFSQAFALHDVVLIYQFHRNVPAVQRETETLLALSREHGFPMWELAAMGLQGWAQAEQGHAMDGLDRMRRGASMRRDIGTRLRIPYHQTRIAELYGKAGQPTEGLAQIQKAFALIEVTGERWWEAEMYRTKGELILQNLAF